MDITTTSFFISVALVVFGISYYYFTTRYKERMAIIEKGLPADFFKGNSNYLPFILLLGIVSIGISFGVFAGAWLDSLKINGLDDIVMPATIFLFLGLSLVVSYFVLRAIIKRS